ncbi:MAG: hypothetical protein K2M16_03495 [Muribaculaceae bacterium]|nr:hypothetical protein [Muribaculaceae bacterium]
MRLKIAPLLLSAFSVAAMSAQTPSGVQDIYSLQGVADLSSGTSVVYSFGSWHAGSNVGEMSAWSPLFEEMIADGATSSVGALRVEADGISIAWNSVDRKVTVICNSGKIGRASVLIASMDGAARGVEAIKESRAEFSLADYAPGVYAVAVAVDGKLIKTLKINLK